MTRRQHFRTFVSWMRGLYAPNRNPHAVALGKLSAEALKEKRRQVHRQLAAAVGKDWAW